MRFLTSEKRSFVFFIRTIVLISLLVSVLLFSFIPLASAVNGPENAFFTMQTPDGTTSYQLLSSTDFTARIRVNNVGVTPIQVTVSTDSPYCSLNTTDTITIMPDRYDEVSFLFRFDRELKFDAHGKMIMDMMSITTKRMAKV